MLSGNGTILIADDESYLRESLRELFAAQGYTVLEAADGTEVMRLLRDSSADTILLDLKMPKLDGISTLKALKKDPELRRIPVVIVTAFGGSEQTIEGMKAGAYDYVTKPFDPDEVLRTAARAIEVNRLSAAVEELRARADVGEPGTAQEIIGQHPSMREIFKLIGRVAPSDASVLIVGESGTGKELIAQAIHRHSRRASGPIVSVNCAAIPSNLLESELFGYERGAFTGATAGKPGRIEQADGGTLFLDEIGDLPLEAQAKLLRALQEHNFERLGGVQTIASNFRLLAATNHQLDELVSAGEFREDLLYRLNVVRIELPPLRARRADIAALAEHFLRCVPATRSDPPSGFSEEALRSLLTYDYPGSRQCSGASKYYRARRRSGARGPLITVEDLPSMGVKHDNDDSFFAELMELPLEQAVASLERRMIGRALHRSRQNKAEAARVHGINRQLLYSKLKYFDME
jgi:two-component system, NtrC family, response regulator AtoC